MIPIVPVDPSMTLVHHFLERSARLYPDKVALIHSKVRATYAEIDIRADNLARHLLSRGLQKGDRIALLMENSLEYVISYYGIMKAGGVSVPLNSDLKPEGLRYVIEDLEARILITNSRFEKLIASSELVNLGITHVIMAEARGPLRSRPEDRSAQGVRTAPLEAIGNATTKPPPFTVIDFNSVSAADWLRVASYELSSSASSASSTSPPASNLQPPTAVKPGATSADPSALCSLPSAARLEPSDLASIIYTSGSTGSSKGVMLTHKNIVDNTFSICQYLHLTENDIQMVVLPFFYVMGKSLLNTHFAVGGSVVINNQFAFPAAVLKEMVREGVTGFSGVPSTFAYLVHRSPLATMREQLTSLRYVSQAGGHMARTIKEELRKILPSRTDIFIMYGATEASARLSYLEPDRLSDRINSAGKAIPGVTLKIVKEDGTETSAGEVGELIASGSNIMQGYWEKQEDTERALKNGWYYTGDQAYVDEEGFIFLVGRNDDLLKVGGHRLNPQEVEDALLESGFFVEATVLGLPDEFLGKRLVTLGVPANGNCTNEEVMSFCARKLPKFKIPSEVRFVRSLPKKSSGKIDRSGCLALFLQSGER
jgi:acyl-CoA synthetase (AMP-forming)/AMP-acid ligase II